MGVFFLCSATKTVEKKSDFFCILKKAADLYFFNPRSTAHLHRGLEDTQPDKSV